MVKDLQKVVVQDPLAQLDEQDKELIWKMRSGTILSCFYCGSISCTYLHRNVCLEQFPNSLPKLLQSTAWNNRGDTAVVSIMHVLVWGC